MYDCVINHISKSSDWFQRYLAGDEQYQEYFIESDLALIIQVLRVPAHYHF